MKSKPSLLATFLVITLFTACSKKENTTPVKTVNSNLTGRWYYASDTVKSYVDGSQTQLLIDEVTANDYNQFNSDGSGYSSGSGYITKYTYSVKGNQLTINTPAQTVDGEPVPANIEIATIRQLTDTTLFLYFDDKGSDASGTYETTEALHCAKQPVAQ